MLGPNLQAMRGSRLVAFAVGVVVATSCGSSQPTGTSPTAASIDLCADKLPPVPAGLTNGKLVGTINTGRILTIEASKAGTSPAYIDAGGFRNVS